MPLIILCGIVAGIGQVPLSLPWATLIAIAFAFLLLRAPQTILQTALASWLFGLGYFAATLHWIVEPFFVDPDRHGWMAPFALLLMAGGGALFWAVGAALARYLAPDGTRFALAWVAGIASAELLRSYLFTDFPWALIGHVWIGWAPMQLASWVGAQGLTILTLALPVAAVSFWPRRTRTATIGAIGLALYALGLALDSAAPGIAAEDRPLLRLVQPNAPQHLKWHPDHVLTFFERQVEFTALPSERPLDLIIWPETSVPTLLSRADNALDHMTVAAKGTPLVFGIQRRVDEDAFNSLAVLDAGGEVSQIYDKHHLVPFGEYIPGFKILAQLPFGAFVREHGFGYAAGPGARTLDLGKLGKVLPLICYEAIFPQDVNATSERADWLLQITNDAWFGNWVGPYQHLAQARLRAVEQGLPMVRVANTGVSAVIDAKGRIVAQTSLNEAGVLDHILPPALPETIYARTGDWPFTALYLLLITGLWGTRRLIQH